MAKKPVTTTEPTELPTRAQILRMLRQGKCSFTFQKAGGRLRKMNATLNTELLDGPPDYPVDAIDQSKQVLTAYDLDNEGELRSFRIDSLRRFKGPND